MAGDVGEVKMAATVANPAKATVLGMKMAWAGQWMVPSLLSRKTRRPVLTTARPAKAMESSQRTEETGRMAMAGPAAVAEALETAVLAAAIAGLAANSRQSFIFILCPSPSTT